MQITFAFELGQRIEIKVSGEQGTVTGVAKYDTSTVPAYFVHYKASDGRAVSAWWDEDQLAPAEDF